MQWIEENKPQSCEIINVGLDLDWLAKHEKMLFPQDSSIAGHWFSIVQHKAQREYFLRNELDMILLGRRRADGNYTGKGGNIYTDSKGVTRFSPIADWTHEQVLAFIYYNEIPLPPFTAGRMDICAVLTPGLHVSGLAAQKTAGRKSTTSTLRS